MRNVDESPKNFDIGTAIFFSRLLQKDRNAELEVHPGGRSAGEGDGTPDGVLGCAEPHLRGSDLGIVYRASKFVWQYDHSTKTKSVYFFFRSSRSFSISLRPWRGTLWIFSINYWVDLAINLL